LDHRALSIRELFIQVHPDDKSGLYITDLPQFSCVMDYPINTGIVYHSTGPSAGGEKQWPLRQGVTA